MRYGPLKAHGPRSARLLDGTDTKKTRETKMATEQSRTGLVTNVLMQDAASPRGVAEEDGGFRLAGR